MNRPTHLNPFSGAQRKQGGQNPFLGVLPGLIRQMEESRLSPATERALIDVADCYARENGLSFTPNMRGVVKMAEDAHKMHLLHMDALNARERQTFDPSLTGYDHATGFER